MYTYMYTYMYIHGYETGLRDDSGLSSVGAACLTLLV